MTKDPRAVKRGKLARRKGKRGERDVANDLKYLYPDARRGWQMRQGAEQADVEGTPFWIECKLGKRCNIKKALEQADEVTDGRSPLAVTKNDREPRIASMYWPDFLRLLEFAQIGEKHVSDNLADGRRSIICKGDEAVGEESE